MGADIDAPRFSAVIPAYNREHCIGRAIESVLAQTEPPAEIVVVNDGSRDATAERIQSYGDHVRYEHQRNAGVSAARNRGVVLCTAATVKSLQLKLLEKMDVLSSEAGRGRLHPSLEYDVRALAKVRRNRRA